MPRAAVLFLILGCLSGLAAVEVTTTADQGAGSLRHALRGGGVVTFSPQLAKQTIVVGETLVIERTLVIDASAAPGVVVSGGGKVRVIESRDGELTLIGLTIVDGRASAAGQDGNGGAVWAHGKALNLKDCTFRGNVALGEGGGAVFVGWKHQTNVLNCTFENNDGSAGVGERTGGAIATASCGKLIVRGSRFLANKGGNGAGINSLLGELLVEDCVFTGNTTRVSGTGTDGYGAAIYTDGASDETNDAIGGTITLRRCQFTGNIGAGQGGATFLFGYPPDSVLVESCVFTRNQVVPDAKKDALGGAIRMGNAAFVLRDSAFIENQAALQGGALWFGETSNGSIINCTIGGNKAGQGGGILAATTSPISLQNCSLVANPGGAISSGPTLTQSGCLVSEGRSPGLVLGPDGVPYLQDQSTGALPGLALSATAKKKAGKATPAAAPPAARPAAPTPAKASEPDLASLMAADPSLPIQADTVAAVKAFLQAELAAGRQPRVLVKVDLVNPVVVDLTALDQRGIRALTARGDEMQIPWKMLPDLELFRMSRPAMATAPMAVYRHWLLLGMYQGAHRDAGFRALLTPLWEGDPAAAKLIDALLKKAGA